MRIFTVDSFTDRPFRGNPAAVCLLNETVPDEWMLAVAGEMRHSETAFVLERDEGPRSLRWFTPAVEVALCGHATLATAHVLYSLGVSGRGESGRLEFDTKSGVLATEQADGGLIAMDFPAKQAAPCPPPDGLAEALGVTPVWTGRSEFDLLVEVGSAEEVRAADPDMARLAEVEARGVIVTASGEGTAADYVSRSSAPGWACRRTPSPVRPTACSRRTGRASSAGTRSSGSRCRGAAGPCARPCAATASNSPGTP